MPSASRPSVARIFAGSPWAMKSSGVPSVSTVGGGAAELRDGIGGERADAADAHAVLDRDHQGVRRGVCDHRGVERLHHTRVSGH